MLLELYNLCTLKSCLLLAYLFVYWQPFFERNALFALSFVFLATRLCHLRICWFKSSSPYHVTNLGTVDLTVQFLVVKVKDFFQLLSIKNMIQHHSEFMYVDLFK